MLVFIRSAGIIVSALCIAVANVLRRQDIGGRWSLACRRSRVKDVLRALKFRRVVQEVLNWIAYRS
jgi:hypothetical protein